MSTKPKVFERPSLSGSELEWNDDEDYEVCLWNYGGGTCGLGYFSCGWCFYIAGIVAGIGVIVVCAVAPEAVVPVVIAG